MSQTRHRFIDIMNLPLYIKPACNLRIVVYSTLIAAITAGTGCHKTEKNPGSTPPPEVTNQQANDHMPIPAQAPATNPVNMVQANGEPDLAELNRSLLRWMMRNHRRPQNFEDFAATAGVTIPPVPAGKKYVIASDMHIKLVNQ